MTATLTLEGRLYFISDLHLEEQRPAITRAFLDFINSIRDTADALFILGDFFEVWVGDDNHSVLISQVVDVLAALSASGCKVFLQHGNRDFLIGEQFAEAAGLSLIPDPCLLHHEGQHYLLMHGDSLCTDDLEYQKFRQMVRSPHWQQQFLSQSLEQRIAFADQARAASKSETSRKSDDIMDVNQAAVDAVMQQYGVDILIHGHTHRPAVHKISSPGTAGKKQRMVLGDWDQQLWYLSLQHQSPVLQHQPINN